jgi:CubicO group peptidase (beta-lactamase class C family)
MVRTSSHEAITTRPVSASAIETQRSTPSPDLGASFDEEAQRESVAGLAAGVTLNGKTVFVTTHGQLSVATESKPIQTSTLFRIASVSKTFTALSVMQLLAKGRFGLDDPVNQHLKKFEVRHLDVSVPHVTIRQLLTHQSGLPEPLRRRELLQPSRFIGPKRGRPVPRLEQLYGSVLRPHWPPTANWAYSNDGYVVLGQLIEDMTRGAIHTVRRRQHLPTSRHE